MLFLDVFTDWRFLCAVVFFGAVAGALFYCVTPLKINRSSRGGQAYLKEAIRTGLGENAVVKQLLKSQSRRLLLYGILLAIVVLSPTFVYAPISTVPNWLYATLGVIGCGGGLFSWNFFRGITKDIELKPTKK